MSIEMGMILPVFLRTKKYLLKNIFMTVVAFLTIAWMSSSVLVYYFERNADGSNIKTFNDALWWGIVTFLTVGYGDRYPITFEGRFIAGLLMVSGVACVGI